MTSEDKLERATRLLYCATTENGWRRLNIRDAVQLIYEAAVQDATTQMLEILVRQKQQELAFRREYDNETSN